MSGAIEWRVPDSVLRVLYDRFYVLEGWQIQCKPDDIVGEIDRELYRSSKRELFAFLMKIRNGSPAAIRACEQFDRGEIDVDGLLSVGGKKTAMLITRPSA